MPTKPTNVGLSLALAIFALAQFTAHAQVPVINVFSPHSGPIGTTVTITGANFSSTASNNVVTFGAVTANVLSAANNQLTVAVPISATYAPITVTVNGLIGSASAPFVVTFPSMGPLSDSSFAAPIALPTGPAPGATKMVDFDGDGKPDLVVANYANGTISVFRNISTNGSLAIGSFAAPVVFPVGSNPYELTVGDIDGDGKPDMIVPSQTGGTVTVYRNTSTPGSFTTNSFGPRVDLVIGFNPWPVAIGDLDGDGKLDIVVGSHDSGIVTILRNIGSPGSITTNSFAPKLDLVIGGSPWWIAIGDIDGDGKADLLVCNDSGGVLSILRNISSPGILTTNSFAPQVDFAIGSRPSSVAIGDLDGDGKPDLAVSTYGSQTVSVLRNTSTVGTITANSFGAKVDLATDGSLHNVVIADLDGDGKPDLAAIGEINSSLSIFRNISTNGVLVAGSFGPRIALATGSNPLSLVIGDLDGDGKPDLAAVNTYSYYVSIFRNINSPEPSITAQPQSRDVAVGSNVTFSVSATGQSPLKYQWYFNANNILTGATNASLSLTNVQLAQSGSYSVLVTNSFGATNSTAAILNVLPPPTITTQPQTQSIGIGTNASFSVSATGSNLSYQWRFNGVAISGATGSTLVLPSVQSTNAGFYAVVITNTVASVTSSNAILTVVFLPKILVQPSSQTTNAGSNITFTVSVQPVLPTLSSGTLKLWLKADAGVITNSAGLVSQWQDQSSSANHAGQSNTNKQPILVNTSGFGGKPALRFDGVQNATTGDYLQGTGDVGLVDGFTSFMMYSKGTQNPAEEIPAFIGVPGSYNSVRGYYISNAEMCFAGWGNDYYSGFFIPASTYRVWTERMNTNKTQIEFFDADATTSFTATRTASGLLTPGSGYYIGGLGSQTRNFQGDIAEVIYYQGTLNETDRQSVESYLKQKYFQASATASVSYQWQFNGTNIDGATNSSLTLTNVQYTNGGSYSVVITNAAGPVTSSNAVLTVKAPPFITLQPQSQSIIISNSVTFTAAADGTAPISYQWQFNAANIDGATSTSLTLNNVQTNSAGSYQLIATNSYGSATSSVAVLTVNVPAYITLQPQSQTIIASNSVTFTAAADGTGLISYQWQFNATNIDGATSTSLTLDNVQTNSAGNYQLIATNSYGLATSSIAVLTVKGFPLITLQPQSQTNQAGATVTFTVTATGEPPFSYQWRKNGVNIPDQTDSSLSLTNVQILNVQLASAGTYSVMVKNYGSIISDDAILTVTNGSALVVAWGSDEFGQATPPSDLTNAVAIAAGDFHSLALRNDGSVVAWGNNDNSQVSPLPEALSNHVATAIAADGAISMALLNDRTVVVWGDNGYEQTNIPTDVTNVVAIAAGSHHSLALKADGTVIGWGYNGDGQHTVPIGLTNVIAIAAGDNHSLALKDDGTVVGFGADDFGQSSLSTNLTGVVSIAANGNHCLALKTNGTVEAWGENTSGESTVPADLTNVVAIAAGQNYSLALLANGTIVGWGNNDFGQLTPPTGLNRVSAMAAGAEHSLALTSLPLLVTATPQSQIVPSGSEVSFQIKVVGYGPISYQWNRNDVAIAGATSAVLSLDNVQLADEGTYSIVVSNTAAAFTNAATLMVCTCEISPNIAYFGTNGGNSNIVITAQAGYPWGVTNFNPDWITITSDTSFTGDGIVTYTVAPLPTSTPRIGTLNVAGRTFLVSQARRDTARPTVTITSPSVNKIVTSSALQITGKASDKAGLIRVVYQLANADGTTDYLPATGTTNWFVQLQLEPGTNIFRVLSLDLSGNQSAVATRTLFYSVSSILTVTTNGLGRITPNLNGKSLLIGKGYSLTAIPKTGQVFSNWTGSVTSSEATLIFLMQSDMVLHANFIANPFLPIRGIYSGLFYEKDGVKHASSGFFTFTLASDGTFSGKMLINGDEPSFSGKFNVAGQVQIQVSRTGKPALTTYLELDITDNASGQVHGTVTDGHWLAMLSGDRAYRSTTTHNSPQAGRYTMLFPANGDETSPAGDGCGIVITDPLGGIAMVGVLADGTAISQTADLSKNGLWPLYVSLYHGKGSILSWVTLSNTGLSSVTGKLSWIKPANAAAKYYHAGFTNELSLVGSTYLPPTGTAALSLSNGVVVLSSGNLSSSLTNSINLKTNNTIVVTSGTNHLQLILNRAYGIVSGSFLHPVTKLTTPIHGVVLQQQNSAAGFFLGTNQSGLFQLQRVEQPE